MKASTNQSNRVSSIANTSQLAQFLEKLLRILKGQGLTAGILCTLFLLIRCQPMIEEAPEPVNDSVTTSMQTVSPLNGTIPPVQCTPGMLDGAIILVCVPANWNGELILYARGYTPAFEELHIADEANTYAPLFTSLGYAFATSSYSQTGLAIQTGIQDMIALRDFFIQHYGQPSEIYLTGASEGGLVTTLAIERYPELWSGGLSLCGPCGDFQRQINYYGNFRVLFDYFFPGVLPNTIVDVPEEMITNWESTYVPAIIQAIMLNPTATQLLLNTSQAPYDPGDPSTIIQTVVGVLTYNLFIHDAVVKLGGQPFDNQDYVYSGTGSTSGDMLLNSTVQRYTADKEATKTIKKLYETSGIIKKPLIKSHTTLDPIQLIWNLTSYQDKVPNGKSSLFAAVPIHRYGHCTFTVAEAVALFTQLQQKVNAQKQHPLAKEKNSGELTTRSVNAVAPL